jgi:glucosamine--fructose-6-phosphate aminotransferase (isomerizing)
MLEHIESEMYRSIRRQPEVLRAILRESAGAAAEAAERLADCARIFVIGTGTSYHAALVGEYLFRQAGADVRTRTAFDFVNYPPDMRPSDGLVVISHRGSKRYGLEAIQLATRHRCTLVGLTGHGSPMKQPSVVVPTSPQELSSAHTMSYTGSLTALALMAVELGRKNGADLSGVGGALASIPDSIDRVLGRLGSLGVIAQSVANCGRVTFAGAGPNVATAREGALKVKETSYLVAEGFEVENLLHGGLQALRRGDVAAVLVADGPAVGRTRDLVRALALLGADILLVADERISGFEAEISAPHQADLIRAPFPPVPEVLSPLLAVVPLQLLAAMTAHLRGTNADSFREDDPAFLKVNQSYEL